MLIHGRYPTTERKENEVTIPHLKLYVSGFPASPSGIEWMRFEEGCHMHPLIKEIPHVAFKVKAIVCWSFYLQMLY